MNIHEQKLISKIVAERKLPTKVNFAYFHDLREEMMYIEQFWMQYSAIPSQETLCTEFPNLEIINTPDPIEFYEAGVIKNHNEREILVGIENMLKFRDEGRIDLAISEAYSIYKNGVFENGKFTDYDDYDKTIYDMYNFRNTIKGKMWRFQSFPSLHEYIPALYGGEFHVIAGRPKAGKSYLALAMMLDLYKQGAKVLVTSGELFERQLIERCDMLLSGISPDFFEGGFLSPHKMNEIKEIRQRAASNGGKLYYLGKDHGDLYSFNQSKQDMRGTLYPVMSFLKEHPVDVVLIDSLYIYKPMNVSRNASTWERVTETIKDAVGLTKDNSVLTITTTQFGRSGERKKTGAKSEDVGYTDAFLQYCDGLYGLRATEEMQSTGTREFDILAVREGERGQLFLDYKFSPNVSIREAFYDFEEESEFVNS